MSAFFKKRAAAFVVSAIVIGLFLAAIPKSLTESERKQLSSALRFAVSYLQPADNGQPMKSVRNVHPAVRHIDAWISSVGASIALADITGTGRPADICLVDPRNDSVSIMPAPETGTRFIPFALPALTEGYDPRTIAPMGCLPADVNEDGHIDLIVYYWGRTPVVYLRDDREISAASFIPVEIVAEREIWNTNAAVIADVDGDGHVDLIFGNYFRDGERVLDPNSRTRFEMQHSMSRAANAGRNRLLLWTGSEGNSVSYRDASSTLPPSASDGWTLAIAARDLDADLIQQSGQGVFKYLPELYFANDFGPDVLLLNRSTPGNPNFKIVVGKRDLVTPRSKVLGQDSFKGMGVDFSDVVGDGHAAIAVSNISSPYALLESHFLFVHTGDPVAWTRNEAPYRDVSYARGTWTSGWAWDIKFADLLNTGHPALIQAIGFVQGDRDRWPELQELAMGNDELLSYPASWPQFTVGDDLSGKDHDRIFLPDSAGAYHDVWKTLGLDSKTVSRGIATADVFGDGKLAVAIARQWSPSIFLRNQSTTTGKAIVLDLQLPNKTSETTRAAIGAEARVRISDRDDPKRTRTVSSVVDGGSGHGGKRAPEIHLGVGESSSNELFAVQISWRDERGPHDQIIQVTPGRHKLVLGKEGCVPQPASAEAEQQGGCRVVNLGN